MKCSKCGAETEVLDSRPMPDGRAVRRRRQCFGPEKHRVTTHEFETARGVAYVPVKPAPARM